MHFVKQTPGSTEVHSYPPVRLHCSECALILLCCSEFQAELKELAMAEQEKRRHHFLKSENNPISRKHD